MVGSEAGITEPEADKRGFAAYNLWTRNNVVVVAHMARGQLTERPLLCNAAFGVAISLALLSTAGCVPDSQPRASSSPTASRASPLSSPSLLPAPSPTRPSVPSTALRVGGAITAATDPSKENACSFGQPFAGYVRLSTPQMPLQDGQALAVTLFSQPSIGTYSALAAASDGRPLVRAERSTRLGGGGDSGDWYARSGFFTVTVVSNVGDHTNWGVIAGSTDASLAWTNGSEPITMRGSFGCVIDAIANG